MRLMGQMDKEDQVKDKDCCQPGEKAKDNGEWGQQVEEEIGISEKPYMDLAHENISGSTKGKGSKEEVGLSPSEKGLNWISPFSGKDLQEGKNTVRTWN